MNALLLILLLGQIESPSAIESPDTAQIGELVRLKVDSEKVSWKVVPETQDFEAVGNIAFFSSRTEGKYLFVVAVIDGENPIVLIKEITITSSTPTIPPPKDILGKLKTVIKENKLKVIEATKLAQSFRALSEVQVPIDKLLEETVAANKRALGDSLESWKPYLDILSTYIDSLDLKTRNDYKKAWLEIAELIEKSMR
jgi:hypothetical protein